MSKLFEVMAGKSSDTFKLGEATFQAAPVTIREYAEFLERQQQGLSEQMAWLADKLKRRLSGTSTSPDLITAEWMQDNLPLPYLSVIQHVLLYGEMPKGGSEKKAP